MNILSENQIEQIALDTFRDELNYQIVHGAELSPDGNQFEREYSEVVLPKRLKQAIDKFNPTFPEEAKEEALKKVLRIVSPNLITGNEEFHKFLIEGVDITFRNANNEIRTDKIWLIDYQNPDNNEFIAVNQFTIIENRNNKRPDIIIFVNGLPLVVFEIKNGTNESTNLQQAYNQLQTYKKLIPSLFNFNALLVITDGFSAHTGTISSDFTRFMQWKSISGTQVEITNTTTGMDVLIRGMLNKRNILDLIRHFIVFEKTKEKTIKKVAAYHQYFAVNKALVETQRAVSVNGDKRAGIIWHTQGSGKSLSMVFYTGKMVLAQELNNPTIVVITDRNDLDQQLFDTFSSCQQIIRQTPVQAESRLHLKELLNIPSGRVIFTTVQKFLTVFEEPTQIIENNELLIEYKFANEPKPFYIRKKDLQLNDRRNIIVIADEAHRSQYDFVDGYARCMRDALPNATFIGFTGTPIDKEDKSTRAIFGDYIDIYDIQQAVKDGATVPIYYESRLAKIELNETERLIIDEKIEGVFSEEDELTNRQRLIVKWTKKEAIVGSEKRIKQIAKDIVEHFCKRIEALEGKAMIVCMSRRICVELHNEIIKLRPDWYHPEDNSGFIKVIMTGSASDPLEWQEHVRNKPRRQSIGDRLKDPKDCLKIAIVRDMWLTGFDAPALHTLYVDKPMNGHNLMQAIARVNRVFGDKTGGLVVDYIGIAQDLKQALGNYSNAGGKGDLSYDHELAVNKMMEYYELIVKQFSGFNYKKIFTLQPKNQISFILDAKDFILGQKDGKETFKNNLIALSKAFGLASNHQKANQLRDDLAFFQAIKTRIDIITNEGKTRSDTEIETTIRQIVSAAIYSEKIVDLYQAAGISRPEISILSDEFLKEIQGMKRKNLALELLKRLLSDEIKTKSKTNIIQSRKFSEMLADAIKRYQNNLITTAQVIEELVYIAREMKAAEKRGEKLGLRFDELAFYDALETNDNAVMELGDDILKTIARELTDNVRKNTTIDWTIKESVRAKLRVMVKRILRKYKYPPDKQENAIKTVLEQAETLSDFWTTD